MYNKNQIYKYTLRFISIDKVFEWILTTKNIEFYTEFRNKLLEVLQHDETKKEVEIFQKNTIQIRKKLTQFVLFYDKQLPDINKINEFINSLEENEYFCIIPNLKWDNEFSFIIHDLLISEKSGQKNSYELAKKKFEKYYKSFFEEYDNYIFGRSRFFQGEKDKTKRACRFCGKSMPDVTFKKEAHAISEGLGNKTLFLNDECDICNEKFSVIESEIIEYLSLWRSLHGVKGKKNKRKKIKTHDFKMSNTEDDKIEIPYKEDFDLFNQGIKFTTPQKITGQNIYKALCKYFISIIEDKDLKYFTETINWLSSEKLISSLPKIVTAISYRGFSLQQPKIQVFLRKNDNKNIPYAVGELSFTCMRLIFIIPFSSQDDRNFTVENDFKRYKEVFHGFLKDENWDYIDFSSTKKQKMTFQLNFTMCKDETI